MTGETAAIAAPRQIPVPTPISVRRSRGMPSSLPYSQAALRQTASVPSITGSDATPTRAASAIDRWQPSSTTEHWSRNVLAYWIPGASRAPGLTASAMAAPMMAPGTALPTSGTCWPTTVATAATATASARPGRTPRARSGNDRAAGAAGAPGPAGAPGVAAMTGPTGVVGVVQASGAVGAAAVGGWVTAFMAFPGSRCR